jgi:hypothetical protein
MIWIGDLVNNSIKLERFPDLFCSVHFHCCEYRCTFKENRIKEYTLSKNSFEMAVSGVRERRSNGSGPIFRNQTSNNLTSIPPPLRVASNIHRRNGSFLGLSKYIVPDG